MSTLTYPGTGKIISYTTGKAGRPTAAQDTADGINYVESATYAPPGELNGMITGKTSTFGGLVTANAFSNRLQPILLSTAVTGQSPVFSECFDFHLGIAINTPPCSFPANTTGDNGNVFQVVNNRDNTRNQIFTYDPLNRIASAESNGTQWGETYTIDPWSNLTNETGIAGKTLSEGLNVSAGTNNQLSGFGYDAAGNMISNSPSTYKYDAENRLVTTGGSTYYYDGDGNRVGKVNGSSGTLYWRGMGGDALSESSLTGTSQEEYIFFGGTRVARRDVSGGAVHYYFSDHLGSHGVVENATGTSCEQDIDYYPYGGVVHDYCPNVTQHYRFTGKERDSESGLDNFGARYHASSLGRFMTPDWADDADPIPYADLRNPQSLNLYAYVQNNPLSSTDDDGHMCIVSASSGGDVCNVGNNIFKMNQGQEYGGVSKDPYTLTIQVWEQFEGTWWSTKVVTAAEWFATLGLGAAVRGGAPFAIAASYFISPPNKYAPDTVDFNKNASKIPHDAADPNGAKAPGKPGAAEGFKDPKTGPKWGKAPNGKNGWIDAQGNVWVPTGQGALAHGGPHWDVQNEDGTFGGSKYPGGFSR